MKRIVVFFVLLGMSGVALAAHFGLEQGESLAQLSKVVTLKKVAPYIYSTSALPDGNVSFNDYRLFITPEQGLCKVVAWTPAIESSVYGEAIMNKFDNLYTALTKKYGHGKKEDFLKSGSIWDDPQDWMMGLEKQERVLTAFWTKEDESTLPPDTNAIMLKAVGVNMNHAMIELGYEFKNFNACQQQAKAAENSSL